MNQPINQVKSNDQLNNRTNKKEINKERKNKRHNKDTENTSAYFPWTGDRQVNRPGSKCISRTWGGHLWEGVSYCHNFSWDDLKPSRTWDMIRPDGTSRNLEFFFWSTQSFGGYQRESMHFGMMPHSRWDAGMLTEQLDGWSPVQMEISGRICQFRASKLERWNNLTWDVAQTCRK